jgi:hypothetical protein
MQLNGAARVAIIYLHVDRALWVFHNGKVVEATYIGGS